MQRQSQLQQRVEYSQRFFFCSCHLFRFMVLDGCVAKEFEELCHLTDFPTVSNRAMVIRYVLHAIAEEKDL